MDLFAYSEFPKYTADIKPMLRYIPTDYMDIIIYLRFLANEGFSVLPEIVDYILYLWIHITYNSFIILCKKRQEFISWYEYCLTSTINNKHINFPIATNLFEFVTKYTNPANIEQMPAAFLHIIARPEITAKNFSTIIYMTGDFCIGINIDNIDIIEICLKCDDQIFPYILKKRYMFIVEGKKFYYNPILRIIPLLILPHTKSELFIKFHNEKLPFTLNILYLSIFDPEIRRGLTSQPQIINNRELFPQSESFLCINGFLINNNLNTDSEY